MSANTSRARIRHLATTLVCAVLGYPYAYLMATSGPRLAALLAGPTEAPPTPVA